MPMPARPFATEAPRSPLPSGAMLIRRCHHRSLVARIWLVVGLLLTLSIPLRTDDPDIDPDVRADEPLVAELYGLPLDAGFLIVGIQNNAHDTPNRQVYPHMQGLGDAGNAGRWTHPSSATAKPSPQKGDPSTQPP